jgi:succinate dehydrogenase / fumarate reductase cytochrome b subunit
MKKERPLSPHLQIYKPQITSISSITHRITGFALYILMIFICWYIFSYSFFGSREISESCDCYFYKIIKIGFYTALFFSCYYHLLNGVRHLFWDIGIGFDLKNAKIAGYLIFFFSISLTIFTLFYIQ